MATNSRIHPFFGSVRAKAKWIYDMIYTVPLSRSAGFYVFTRIVEIVERMNGMFGISIPGKMEEKIRNEWTNEPKKIAKRGNREGKKASLCQVS